jgi:hypothetical protein
MSLRFQCAAIAVIHENSDGRTVGNGVGIKYELDLCTAP